MWCYGHIPNIEEKNQINILSQFFFFGAYGQAN